jgi:hypothetical protein
MQLGGFRYRDALDDATAQTLVKPIRHFLNT